ncbi:MAG: hypothetical protein WD669_10760 [Pirellulales bacterium]
MSQTVQDILENLVAAAIWAALVFFCAQRGEIGKKEKGLLLSG